MIASPVKAPLPILSFPSVQLMGVTVGELITNSNLQAQGMKAVADRVAAGAAVSFMDLSVEAECFGADIRFSDDEVPTVLGALVTTPEEAEALTVPTVGTARSGIYVEAIEKAVALIEDRPVLAGMIGPFSLAGRLIGVTDVMIACYEEPEMVHTVMQKATEFAIRYGNAYKAAGANGVMIAEPLTGMLSPALAKEFSHPYLKQVIDALQEDTFAVFYHNCGDNVARMHGDIYALGAAGYHFGDAIRLLDVLADAPQDVPVMGNISPSAQFCSGTPASVTAAVAQLKAACGGYRNFVISSGCDLPPHTPWDNIDAFFAAAKQ